MQLHSAAIALSLLVLTDYFIGHAANIGYARAAIQNARAEHKPMNLSLSYIGRNALRSAAVLIVVLLAATVAQADASRFVGN